MRKFISFILLGVLCSGASFLSAQDLLPSDTYYKDNIAVNEVHAKAPTLKSDEDDDDGPGGSEWGGGGWVGSPVGDAVVPITIAGLVYASVLTLRRRKSSL